MDQLKQIHYDLLILENNLKERGAIYREDFNRYNNILDKAINIGVSSLEECKILEEDIQYSIITTRPSRHNPITGEHIPGQTKPKEYVKTHTFIIKAQRALTRIHDYCEQEELVEDNNNTIGFKIN